MTQDELTNCKNKLLSFKSMFLINLNSKD